MDKVRLIELINEIELAQANVTSAKFKLMDVEKKIVIELCSYKDYHLLKPCINSMRYNVKHS